MLELVKALFFESPSRDPYRANAVVNRAEIVAIVPAGWEITRWLSGGPCVEISLSNGRTIYAQGRPEDFVGGERDA